MGFAVSDFKQRLPEAPFFRDSYDTALLDLQNWTNYFPLKPLFYAFS